MTSSSMSPPNIKNEYGAVGTGIAYGAQPLSSNQVPPSHDQNNPLGIGLANNLAEKRFTRDGQPTKRRGPKPDSKPALTRRQELNRQAQRTHRERKEFYIKALEDEVLRLKEIYSNVSQDKERLAEENRSLKAMLQQNGLSISGPTATMDDNMSNPSVGPYISSTSSASVNGSGSYGLVSTSTQNTSYTPPPGSAMSTTTAMHGTSPPDGISPNQHAAGLRRHSPTTAYSNWPQRKSGTDYDQAGIDFVLSLERPCMEHLPWLLERSNADGEQEPCGHSLMASCPPEPFADLTPDIPFGPKHGNKTTHPPNDDHTQQAGSINTSPPIVSRNFSRNRVAVNPANACGRACAIPNSTSSTTIDVGNPAPLPRTWELSKADLATLLDLSQKLNLDGEITPVMAWGMVLGHPRLGELNERDFVKLTEDLRSKVRCYGFGAVMEEFEVRDALVAILSTKPEPLALGTGAG